MSKLCPYKIQKYLYDVDKERRPFEGHQAIIINILNKYLAKR